MAKRVWLEGHRREEGFVDDFRGQLNLIGRDQIPLPKLEGPASHGRLIGDSAENKTPVGLQIVVVEELLTSFEGKISPVNEVFMKSITLGIDVIDLVAVLAINYEQSVGQGVRRVGVVGDGNRVELCFRGH